MQTGSFVLRLLSFIDDGLLPQSAGVALQERTPKFWAWANAVVKEESVNFIYDAAAVAAATKKRMATLSPDSRWAK